MLAAMVWSFRRAGWIATFGSIACGGDDGGSGGSTSEGASTTSSSADTSASATANADSSGGVDSGSSSGAATTSEGGSTGEPVMPQVLLPRTSISVDELAVLVNDDDPQSVAVADDYVRARGIPVANVVHLQLPVGQNVLSQQDFAAAKALVDAALDDDIQAQAITWTRPYRVDCMSITSAFALGFDMQYCATPCNPTAEVDYYDSQSLAPWTDHGIRPAMMLAGADADQVQQLVDRGVASDGTRPFGEGYLVRTTDVDRSSRWPEFPTAVDLFDHDGGLLLQFIDNSDGSGLDYIESTRDVLFYFTGLANVPQIATNTYLPGAMADHLTSFGGEVPTSSQMSSVAWLEAGATGSYGTVVEPCNYPSKFPNPVVALPHYFRGQTLIEAYWKSVAMPGEGLFVGEPLARPWGESVVSFDPLTLTLSIETTLFAPDVVYEVQAADTADGPWTTVFSGSVPYPVDISIEIADATSPYYRLVPT
jgi:uncharacterized protein (TIGR03790 family)